MGLDLLARANHLCVLRFALGLDTLAHLIAHDHQQDQAQDAD